jgi:cytochrome P450
MEVVLLSGSTNADAVASFVAAIQSGSYYEDSAPAWAALRQVGTVVKLPFGNGIWACTTWAGCAALARDPRMSAARADRFELALPTEHRHEMKPFTAILGETVLFLDPPRHTQVRKLLNRAFTPEVIARNRARIAELFDQLLDEWIKKGESEIMETLVHPFPALVIADWMGLPRSEWATFMIWADALLQVGNAALTGGTEVGSVRKWLALVEKNRAYLEAVVEGRQSGGSDLFGLLMEMEEGEVLDRAQLVAQALIILLAGHETTRNLIGSGLHWLLTRSYNYYEFDDDLSKRLAVDEILRLASPVVMTSRLVSESFEFEGASLRKGDYLFLAWASANRDPQQFPQPERMDLRRRNNPHLAFGAGPHACLGLHLARTETQIAFEHLWSRLSNIRLAQPPPEWNQSLVVHGPVRLHVAYDRP